MKPTVAAFFALLAFGCTAPDHSLRHEPQPTPEKPLGESSCKLGPTKPSELNSIAVVPAHDCPGCEVKCYYPTRAVCIPAKWDCSQLAVCRCGTDPAPGKHPDAI